MWSNLFLVTNCILFWAIWFCKLTCCLLCNHNATDYIYQVSTRSLYNVQISLCTSSNCKRSTYRFTQPKTEYSVPFFCTISTFLLNIIGLLTSQYPNIKQYTSHQLFYSCYSLYLQKLYPCNCINVLPCWSFSPH